MHMITNNRRCQRFRLVAEGRLKTSSWQGHCITHTYCWSKSSLWKPFDWIIGWDTLISWCVWEDNSTASYRLQWWRIIKQPDFRWWSSRWLCGNMRRLNIWLKSKSIILHLNLLKKPSILLQYMFIRSKELRWPKRKIWMTKDTGFALERYCRSIQAQAV